MLPDRYLQLLTAYVDGELSTRQRKAALRLLHRSPEARTVLRQLQQDATRLRQLPRHHLGPDFTHRVLQTIARQPARPQAVPIRHTVPTWVGLAAAAAILMAVGLGAYAYFVSTSEPAQQIADTTPTPAPDPKDKKEDKKKDPIPPPIGPVVQGPDKPEKTFPDPDLPPTPEDMQKKKMDRPLDPGMKLFGAEAQPGTSIPMLKQTLSLKDFDQAKLTNELRNVPALRVGFTCPHTNKAFERLQKVLKANACTLLIEQHAQYRLSRQLSTDYVLYLDDLTADDLVKVLRELAAEDQNAEKVKKGDAEFNLFAVGSIPDESHKALEKLLQDYEKLLPPLKTEVLKPARPTPRATEHPALVLPCNPVWPQKRSAEVKKFFENHKPRPEAMQLLIVLE